MARWPASLVVVVLVAGDVQHRRRHLRAARAIPAFLSQVGLVTAIGLAYVPQTMMRAREIRKRKLRGHRFRGARSLAPLAVPLLAGGLDPGHRPGRGDGGAGLRCAGPVRGADAHRRRLMRARGTGTAFALGAFALLYFRQTPAGGAAALALGLAGIGAALYRLGRLTRHTRYRREVWRRRDTRACLALVRRWRSSRARGRRGRAPGVTRPTLRWAGRISISQSAWRWRCWARPRSRCSWIYARGPEVN